ncbi:hypothetical protein AGMMS50284_3940 [Clostridia bacterium]|nr:hypothetical protein AGMMS50284_3940 [Clostridia bacterium]
MDFKEKGNYSFYDLVGIMKILRAPNGCPWDAEQTHASIRQNFIEETYEVIEAIDDENTELLKEELGDVLLQIVFHAQMEEEKDAFNIDDVADGICKKLIVRHPHVFGDVKADTAEKVLKNWDDIKMRTKSQKKQTEAMLSVSRALPALMRSQKIQQKAAKVGFDWSDVNGAAEKLDEEVAELKEAIKTADKARIEDELGDVLFSAVNVARFAKTDAEKVLYNACEKFISRFKAVEEQSLERGINIQDADTEILEDFWNKAKQSEL